jgi:hypothetical protein
MAYAGLTHVQRVHDIVDAGFPFSQQAENLQPRLVGEAFHQTDGGVDEIVVRERLG